MFSTDDASISCARWSRAFAPPALCGASRPDGSVSRSGGVPGPVRLVLHLSGPAAGSPHLLLARSPWRPSRERARCAARKTVQKNWTFLEGSGNLCVGAAVAHRGARCGTELPDARRRRSGRQAGKRHDVKGALLGDTLGIWCVLRVVLVIGSEYFSYMLAGKWRGWTGIPQWTWRSVRRQLCDVAGIREVGCRLAKQKKNV